jgi:L-amino acid N-acyltransferase YncA
MDFIVQKMKRGDLGDVLGIYEQGIAGGDATFETSTPGEEKWDEIHLPVCRLVARSGGKIIGWAALSPISGRPVYSGVAEVSIYVAFRARGKGLGKDLLMRLTEESEKAGIWTLEAGMFPENKASISLFRSCGFREVGYREKLGSLNGIWRDVILLERRSRKVGP